MKFQLACTLYKSARTLIPASLSGNEEFTPVCAGFAAMVASYRCWEMLPDVSIPMLVLVSNDNVIASVAVAQRSAWSHVTIRWGTTLQHFF
mgnify:CR=1 FL=1